MLINESRITTASKVFFLESITPSLYFSTLKNGTSKYVIIIGLLAFCWSLLEVKLSYDPVCPSIDWSVSLLVGRLVYLS